MIVELHVISFVHNHVRWQLLALQVKEIIIFSFFFGIMIYDDYIYIGRFYFILLLERVAAERCDKIGQSVGYAVRGETKVKREEGK